LIKAPFVLFKLTAQHAGRTVAAWKNGEGVKGERGTGKRLDKSSAAFFTTIIKNQRSSSFFWLPG
jgi:hypothetical protein